MNKRNILTVSFLFLPFFLPVLLSGCAAMMAYEGPALPKEDISVITTATAAKTMAQKATPLIFCINGERITDSEIHVLPGKHHVVAGFTNTPVYGLPIGMRLFVSSLEFETQPGHEYHINGGVTKGLPLMWVQDTTTNQTVTQSVATDQTFKGRDLCKEF
jgi:hypothetical protein